MVKASIKAGDSNISYRPADDKGPPSEKGGKLTRREMSGIKLGLRVLFPSAICFDLVSVAPENC